MYFPWIFIKTHFNQASACSIVICACIAGFNVIHFHNQEIRTAISWADRLVRAVG